MHSGSIEIRTIIAVNMQTGGAKATLNKQVQGKPKLIKRNSSTICFDLGGSRYWTTPAAWKGRERGFIEVSAETKLQ